MCTLKNSKSGIMSNIFVRFCGPLLTMFPPPPKKIYIWGLRTPDPSPAPPPMVRDWRRNSVEFVTKRNKGIRNKSYFWKKTGQYASKLLTIDFVVSV